MMRGMDGIDLDVLGRELEQGSAHWNLLEEKEVLAALFEVVESAQAFFAVVPGYALTLTPSEAVCLNRVHAALARFGDNT